MIRAGMRVMTRPDSRSDRPAIEIADILRRHGDAYRRVHAGHLGRVERRVMSAIVACRTEALGGHVEACDDCGTTRVAYNSCRNRHCPKCQGRSPGRVARRARSRTAAGSLFPRRLHTARADRRHRLPEQGRRLCDPVQGRRRGDDDARRQSAPARRRDRRRRRPAHLGAGADASSPRPLRRAGRRPLARWHALDRQPTELLPGRQTARPAVPPPVPRTSDRRLRRRRP